MEISLENLYVDTGAYSVNKVQEDSFIRSFSLLTKNEKEKETSLHWEYSQTMSGCDTVLVPGLKIFISGCPRPVDFLAEQVSFKAQ